MKNIYILSDDNRRRFEFISLSFVYYFRGNGHSHSRTHRKTHARTRHFMRHTHTCLNKNVICVACGVCVTVSRNNINHKTH